MISTAIIAPIIILGIAVGCGGCSVVKQPSPKTHIDSTAATAPLGQPDIPMRERSSHQEISPRRVPTIIRGSMISRGCLVGHFYDLNQLADSSPQPNPSLAILQPGPLAKRELSLFTQGTWGASDLAKFYRAPVTLYASQFFITDIRAEEAPKAFRAEKTAQGDAWIIHYQGRVSPPTTGSYRFVGGAADLLVVRLNGTVVLEGGSTPVSTFKSDISPLRIYSHKIQMRGVSRAKDRRSRFVTGNKMDLRAGLFYEIDIIIGKSSAEKFSAFLYFEQEGVTYKKDPRGNPILPVFRVDDAAPLPTGATIPPFMPDGPVWHAVPHRFSE